VKSFIFEIVRNGAVGFSKARISPGFQDMFKSPNSLNNRGLWLWGGKAKPAEKGPSSVTSGPIYGK